MLIRSRPNSLFVVLVGLIVLITVLIFAASAKLTNLILPQTTHIFNETVVFCQGIGNTVIAQFSTFSPLLIILSFLLIVFFIRAATSVIKIACLQKNIQATTIPLPSFVKKILGQLGVRSSRVVLYNSYEPSVFCAGFAKPKIYLSSALTRNLSSLELKAILAHEVVHLRSYDPLRTFFTSLFERTFRFIPLVQHVARQIRLAQETTADSFAVEIVSKKNYLRTILKVEQLQLAHTVPNTLGFDNFINQRAVHLLGKPAESNVTKTAVHLGISSTILLTLTFFTLLPLPTQAQITNHPHIKNVCQISYSPDCCLS